jgi:hypothetical protein
MPNDISLLNPCAAYAFGAWKGEIKRNNFDVQHFFIWSLKLGEI